MPLSMKERLGTLNIMDELPLQVPFQQEPATSLK